MRPLVFCIIDGLRPEAITALATPTLWDLIRQGRYTLAAQSVVPSITLPCHMSIFHSCTPQKHSIVTNTWEPPSAPTPGLFEVVHEAGLRTAAYYNWEELRDLWRPGALDLGFFWRDNKSAEGDARVAHMAAKTLKSDAIDLAFVYMGHTDSAGHRSGWLSEDYMQAVAQADRCVQTLREAMGPESIFIVAADHGGHDHGHGTDAPEDLCVPLILAGEGIPGGELDDASLLDIAPTVVKLLGLPQPKEWIGRPLV